MNGAYDQAPKSKPIHTPGDQARSFFRRHRNRLILTGVILLAFIILASQCLFIVGEAEQAVVSRFGVIKRVIINSHNTFHEDYVEQLRDEITSSEGVTLTEGSGLQWKVPFVDNVEKFSARLYTYTSESEVVNTADKKQYYVSTFAQWSIKDPALFSLKLGSMTNAENQLDNLIHPVMVQLINRMEAENFISNKDALNSALASGLRTVNEDMVLRGIEVKDIQVHSTVLPQANLESTYARMQADRAKVAQQLRSEGQEEYMNAMSSADLEARKIEAEAVSEAGRIRGEGEAASLEIYAASYGKDPSFFSYWRSLEALASSIDETSTLVLDQNHPLWHDILTWATGEAK